MKTNIFEIVTLFLMVLSISVFSVQAEERNGCFECSSTISTIVYISATSSVNNLDPPSDLLHCHFTPQIVYQFFESINRYKINPIKRPQGQKSHNKVTAIMSVESNGKLGLYEKLEEIERIAISTSAPLVYKNEEVVLLRIHPWNMEMFKEVLKSPFGKKLKYKAISGWNEVNSQSDSSSIQSLQNSPHHFYSSCDFCKNSQSLIPLKDDVKVDKDLWIDNQQDFHGSNLRLSTPPAGRPRLNYTLQPDGKYQIQNGLLTFALKYMKQKLNFSIELRPASRGGGTGTQFPNGSWGGVISDILYGDADVGMITAETYSRTKVVGFTRGFVVESVVLVTGPPKRIFVWESIFWPLRADVWAALIFVIATSVLMMKLTFFLLSSEKRNQWETSETFEFIFKTLLNQSTNFPRNNPTTLKIFIAMWLLCGSIITTAYLSKLVGFLTFPILEKAPQTAEELAAASDYSWALTYLGGAAHALIKSTKSKTYEQIFSKLELATDFIKCLTRTLEDKFVCISYDTVPKFYLNNRIDLRPGQSPFIIAPIPFISLPVGMSFEKRAVFSPNIDEAVRGLEAAGLIPVWEQMDFRIIRKSMLEKMRANTVEDVDEASSGESNVENDGQTSLTLKHFQGAFVILLFGSLSSTIIMAWEKTTFL